jgi:hypothetical protein
VHGSLVTKPLHVEPRDGRTATCTLLKVKRNLQLQSQKGYKEARGFIFIIPGASASRIRM